MRIQVPPVRAGGVRVLIAEDDHGMAEAVRALLSEAGFDVVGVARNGAEAVELARSTAPDAVLMDFRMPLLDGAQATHVIKRHSPAVRVVVLSAYHDSSLRSAALKAGASSYVVKGCPASAVIEALLGAGEDQGPGSPMTTGSG